MKTPIISHIKTGRIQDAKANKHMDPNKFRGSPLRYILTAAFLAMGAFASCADDFSLEEILSKCFSKISLNDQNTVVFEMIRWFEPCAVRTLGGASPLWLWPESGTKICMVRGCPMRFSPSDGLSITICITNGCENGTFAGCPKSWNGDLLMCVRYMEVGCMSGPGYKSIDEYYVANLTRSEVWTSRTGRETAFKMPFEALWADCDDFKKRCKYNGASCQKPYSTGEKEMLFYMRRRRKLHEHYSATGKESWTVAYVWDDNSNGSSYKKRFSHAKIARLKQNAEGNIVMALADAYTNGYCSVFFYDASRKQKCRVDRLARKGGVEFLYNEYDDKGGFVWSRRITKDHPLEQAGIDDPEGFALAKTAFETEEDLFRRFMSGDFDIPPPEICPRPHKVSAAEIERLKKKIAERDENQASEGGKVGL